jgi:hypothetical protein
MLEDTATNEQFWHHRKALAPRVNNNKGTEVLKHTNFVGVNREMFRDGILQQ